MRWLILVCCFAAHSAHAEFKFGFADLNANFLDWSEGTERKSTKRDFSYLELEGYAEFDWGDVYGFFDYENPGQRGVDVRTAAKGAVHRKLGLGGLTAYAHVYSFSMHGFFEQNRVLGLGYSFAGAGWWFKPFVGFHDVSQTFFSGPNGFMAGWTVGYWFEFLGERWMAADWHEFEFERKAGYAAGQGGGRTSHNGAVSLWWQIDEKVSAGVQGRYVTSKLGTPGSSGAMIYTLKYFL